MKKTLLFCLLALSLAQATAQSDTVDITRCLTFWKDGTPIEDATLTIDIDAPGLPPITSFEDSDGNCDTVSLIADGYPSGTTFYLSAAKDGDDDNGVTILDLVKMSRHILGLEPLPNAYAMLAADANHSNSITTFDIVETRKLLLGIYLELPNSTSWRFFPDYCTFPTPQNPFSGSCLPIPLDELPALDGETIGIVGVKIGDVDGDANPNGLYAGLATLDSVTLIIPDQMLVPGDTVNVPFYLQSDYAMVALQAAFWIDDSQLEFVDLVDNFYWAPSAFGIFPGSIRTANFSVTDPFQPNQLLFELRFTANDTVALSEVFGLDSLLMSPVGVAENRGDVLLKVGSAFESSVATQSPATRAAIAPASPNPFHDQTGITLHLTHPETVRLEVFDLTGQRRYATENLFLSGANRLEIPAEAVTPGSIGIYRLQVGARVETGKIVRD